MGIGVGFLAAGCGGCWGFDGCWRLEVRIEVRFGLAIGWVCVIGGGGLMGIWSRFDEDFAFCSHVTTEVIVGVRVLLLTGM